jgi:hypothetical protein
MSKSYSNLSKQQRMLQKYGPKPASVSHKDKDENEKIVIEKKAENPVKQIKAEVKNEILAENIQSIDIPPREVNPIKEFEKIFAKYLK